MNDANHTPPSGSSEAAAGSLDLSRDPIESIAAQITSLSQVLDKLTAANEKLLHALHGDQSLSGAYLNERISNMSNKLSRMVDAIAEHDKRICELEARMNRAAVIVRELKSKEQKNASQANSR